MPEEHTLMTVDTQAKYFADALSDLAIFVKAIDDSLRAVEEAYAKQLRQLEERFLERYTALKNEITAAPDAFVVRKSLVLHGIKVGFEKGKGKVEWDNEDRVVTLIRRNYTDVEAEALLRAKYSPDRLAISRLPAAEVKAIGCRIDDTGDRVIIRPIDSDAAKRVSARLDTLKKQIESEK